MYKDAKTLFYCRRDQIFYPAFAALLIPRRYWIRIICAVPVYHTINCAVPARFFVFHGHSYSKQAKCCGFLFINFSTAAGRKHTPKTETKNKGEARKWQEKTGYAR